VILPARIVAALQQCPAEERYQLCQSGMDAGAVQAFVVVLPEYLPVALNRLAQRMPYREIPQPPIIEPVQRQIKSRREWRRLIRQRGENETVPLIDRQAVQREIAHVEAIAVLLGRGLHEIAAQTVSPAVIRTHDAGGGKSALRASAQRGSPMPTGVVEGARDQVLGAGHEDRLVTHLEGAEAARCADLTRAADVDPVAVPDLGHFPLVVRRIEIKRRGRSEERRVGE